MKNNISFCETTNKIIWYNINRNGYVNNCLKNKPAVYIFMKISYLGSKEAYYIGSTAQLVSRINRHRSCVNNKRIESPIFYNSVLKYGWTNFKFGVLEYLDLSNIKSSKEKKDIILEKEQYYLDNIKPSLNVCKKADSALGIIRNTIFGLNLSKSRRGKTQKPNLKNPSIKVNNIPKIITNETRLRKSLRSSGISVKVLDKKGNLVYTFPTIRSAAKYLGVTSITVSNIFKTGKSYDNFVYEFYKENKVWVCDYDNKLIKVFDDIKKVSVWSSIPYSTIYKYIKSSKLYKNKYYFYDIKSKSNPYFDVVATPPSVEQKEKDN